MTILQTEQLRLHAQSVLPNSLGAASGALVLAVLQRQWVAEPALWAWLACMAAAIGARVWVRHRYLRRPGECIDAVWLKRYRLTHLVSGTVWGLAGLLLFPVESLQQQTLLAFVLAGVAAASVMLHAFDLKASLYFAVPAMLPLGLRLIGGGGDPNIAMGAMVLIFLALIVFVSRRAHRQVLDMVALRDTERRRADQARRSEELLHTIFRHAAEGIAVFDRELRLVAANDQCLSIAGLEADLLAPGVSLHDVRRLLERAGAAVDADPDTDADSKTEKCGSDQGDDEPNVRRYRMRDQRCIEMRRSPVPDGGCVTLFVDITERLRTEAALGDKQRLLSLLMDTTLEGFWFIDNELRTTDLNAAMCQLLGRPREQIIGHKLFDFVDADNAAIFREQIKQRNLSRTGAYEIALLRPDGSLMHCFNNATPVHDAQGRQVGAVGLFTDISAHKHAQATLQHTTELLQQKSNVLELTLNSVSQGILSLDAEGRCNAYNQRLIELLELPVSLFEQMPTLQQIFECQFRLGHFGASFELVDPRHHGDLHRAIAGERPAALDHYVRKSVSGRVLEVDSHTLADGCVVRTFTDVSQHHHAVAALRASEAHARKLALVAAHTDSAVSISDADGRIEWVNDGFVRLTGYTLAEMKGQRICDVLRGPDTDVETAAAIDAQLARGERCSGENLNYTKDGRCYWVGFEIEPVRDEDGRMTHFIANERDISARKASEAALVAARDEAERANRAKSQFLSRVSHELRTPMNAILGFGQLLESSADLPATLRAYVRELLHGGTHLLNLINEVLDLARIESGQFQLSYESVDLQALAGECLAMLAPLAGERGIVLSTPTAAPAYARADRMRLKQVLLNLLSNAIKYNFEGGKVSVCFTPDGDSVMVHVCDTGPGLDAQQVRQLFKAFERLDAQKSAIEGTGIGLALSRRLTQVMGGDIGVHSQPGHGSDFWVRLPQAAAPLGLSTAPARAPGSSAEPAGGARHRDGGEELRTVLYIEDDPVNQMLMEAMLAQLDGVHLIQATLPAIGLELARQHAPELILLDIQLPGMDGYAVLEQLQGHASTRHTPVIAVSANAMHGDVERGLNAGFCQYLTKPLEMGKLLDAVSRQLREVDATAA